MPGTRLQNKIFDTGFDLAVRSDDGLREVAEKRA